MKNKRFSNIVLNSLLISCIVITLLLSLSLYSRVVLFKPVDTEIEDAKHTKQEVIQVAIINACGEKGIAAKAQKFMRSLGYDVVETGNSNEKLASSIVIDRLGDKKSAFKVAYALGINENQISKHIDSTLFLRATIIIGKDYKTLKPFN